MPDLLKQTGQTEVLTADKISNTPPASPQNVGAGSWVEGSGEVYNNKWVWQPAIPSSSAKDSLDNLNNNFINNNNSLSLTQEDSINNKINENNSKSSKGANSEGLLDNNNAVEDSKQKYEEYKYTNGSLTNFAGFIGGSDFSVAGIDDFVKKQNQQNQKSLGVDNLNGFVVPWDKWGRFATSYSNSQSIGNKMPYGAEWVGSPALVNDHALIRFEQIAGRTHHTLILNQRGEYSFRSSRKRLILKTNSNESQLATVGVKTRDNNSRVISKDDLERKYGLSSNSKYSNANDTEVTVNADENTGELFVDVVDTTKIVWKIKDTAQDCVQDTWIEKITTRDNESKASTTEEISHVFKICKNEEPTTKEFDKFTVEPDMEQPKVPPTNETQNSNDSTDEEKNANQDITSDDNISVKYKSGWSNNPTNELYWLFTDYGWQKCGDSLIPGDAICKNGKPVVSKNNAAGIIKTAKKQIIEAKVKANRGWEKGESPVRRQYLFQPNADSNNVELLEPTTVNLCNIDNWKGQEQFSYKFTDFLYNSYYGWIPNNYMVTLRRFPMPVGDNGMIPDQDTTNKFMMPVAKAVTWLSDITGNKISELTTFTSKLNWREVAAHEEIVQGNEQGAEEGSPFSGTAKFLGMVNAVTKGGGSFGAVSGWDEQRAKHDPYADGAYYNKIYGPVNVIAKTKARDRGIEFEHSISLNFHYNLKEIGGINEKAVILEIIANILALTSNNADFWGGANRYFPNKPAFPFLGDKEGMKKWYSGDVTGFMQSVGNQLADTFKGVMDTLNEFLTNPAGALKKLATSGATLAMARKAKGTRPNMLAFKALLSGAPVGEWHLMIGNPYNPFMMIGNLICTGVTFTFSETFGIDDFPEEMVVKITLDHGKPRDKGDIESMFNRGNGRLHYAYFGKEEAWNTASSTKDSKINQWETNKPDKGGENTKKNLNENVVDKSISETARLYNSSSKEAAKLAHKVAFF